MFSYVLLKYESNLLVSIDHDITLMVKALCYNYLIM
jgi:hypothetical protein